MSCGRKSTGVIYDETPIDIKTDLIIFDKNWEFVDFIKDEYLRSTIVIYEDNSYGKVGVFTKGEFRGYISRDAFKASSEYITDKGNLELFVYKEL